jgi:AcrR family transcriptional regulator
MAGFVKTRTYNSPSRRLQLTATKGTVVAAAIALMAKHGYSATTMEQIAGEAGVAVQTVYKHFGSKAAIVMAFLKQAQQDDRLVEQRRRMMQAVDAVEQVKLIAQRARLYAEIGLHASLAAAARADDPELAKAWRRGREDHRRSCIEYARSLEGKGALREGLSVEQAAEHLWVLMSPDLVLMTRRDNDWSLDQCERWLAGVLIRLLLD